MKTSKTHHSLWTEAEDKLLTAQQVLNVQNLRTKTKKRHTARLNYRLSTKHREASKTS